MDIRIAPKTKISISELALDEHVPSVNVAIEIEARADIFSLIRFDCWFECSLIDSFFSAIKQGKKAFLSDFDESFLISIDGNTVTWRYIKKNISKTDSYFFFEGSEAMLENAREKIIEALGNYPKWW